MQGPSINSPMWELHSQHTPSLVVSFKPTRGQHVLGDVGHDTWATCFDTMLTLTLEN